MLMNAMPFKRHWMPIVAVATFAFVLAEVVARGGGVRSLPQPQPMFSDVQLVSTDTTPPTEAQCELVGRRCFTPQTVRAAYNIEPLYEAGLDGAGQTIAIVDSYGSDTIAHDLHVYNQAFGLPAMCGEEGVTCAAGMPTFTRFALQGSPATIAPPSTSRGTGLENKSAWALEVSLDVETAHAIAPMANILLVTTPTAETLGVQGFPQMMNALQYVVDNDLADVVSMSFGAGEGSFHSGLAALQQMRQGMINAQANGVTLFASSGDGGSTNSMKEPVKKPADIPYPSVLWPGSDPLVTSVG